MHKFGSWRGFNTGWTFMFKRIHRWLFKSSVVTEFFKLHGLNLRVIGDIIGPGTLDDLLNAQYVDCQGNQFLAAYAVTEVLETSFHIDIRKLKLEAGGLFDLDETALDSPSKSIYDDGMYRIADKQKEIQVTDNFIEAKDTISIVELTIFTISDEFLRTQIINIIQTSEELEFVRICIAHNPYGNAQFIANMCIKQIREAGNSENLAKKLDVVIDSWYVDLMPVVVENGGIDNIINMSPDMINATTQLYSQIIIYKTLLFDGIGVRS